MRSLVLAAAAVVVSLGAGGAALAQDAAAGERIFAQCRACHQVGPTARNGVGPQLNGMFGRNKGSVQGYSYSAAYNAIRDQTWTEENFRVYIKDPRGVTPGTKMVFAGLRDDTQITNLIAYLKQFNAEGQRSQ